MSKKLLALFLILLYLLPKLYNLLNCLGIMKYSIKFAPEFEKWRYDQSTRSAFQIDDRLDRIKIDGHFGGDHKIIEDPIWGLRWRNGRRIYFAHVGVQKILLLVGGNKNGQKKDIRKAKNVISRELYRN